ncbi:MAG: hypothetical protein GF411_08355 [Candidatus Lokiarchaeota archaeon]|nr:hypothetical protein [Candidatus Lokiarchaeota archaeon]
MRSRTREILRIVFGILTICLILIIFVLSDPPWDTHGSGIAFYSVLAFLSVIATATALGRVRMDASPTHKIMLSGLAFLSLLNIGAALFNFFDVFSVGHIRSFGVFFALLELTLFSIFMLVAGWFNTHRAKENSIWRSKKFIPILIVVLISLYTSSYLLTMNLTLDFIFIPFGYLLGIIAIVCFLLSAYLHISQPNGLSDNDPIRLLFMNILFVFASIVMLIILPAPSSLWVLSLTFQASALLFASIAIGYPILTDLGLSKRMAYGLVIAIISLIILPFVLSHLIEIWLPLVEYVNVGVSVIVHSGGVVFTLVMGFILYMKARAKAAWYHSPIIFLLFSWSIFESSIVIFHLLPQYYGISEPLVPYVGGGIISTIAFLIAIKKILSTSEKPPKISKIAHLIGYAFVIAIVVIGEVIQNQLFAMFPFLIDGILGGIVLLALAYVSTFVMISFILLLVAESGQKATFELVAAGSQSLWIVSLLLRVNFSVWTAGWWMAEAVIGGAITVFPFILTYFYIRDISLTQRYENQSKVYAHLLKEDIEYPHSLAIDAIHKLSGDPILTDSKLESLSEALGQISHADEMTRVLRLLIESDIYDKRDFESTNLVNSIRDAFEQLQASNPQRRLELKLECIPGECSVRSDHLLSTSLYYLMDGIVQRAELITTFEVIIDQHPKQSEMWSVQIKVDMSGETLEQRQNLLRRYIISVSSGGYEFLLMRRLIRMIGGKINMETPSDSESNELLFTILLPIAEDAESPI